MSVRRRLRAAWVAGLTLLVLCAACEAGPSAFDRRGGSAVPPTDTATVASLPELPEPEELEAARLEEDAEGREPTGLARPDSTGTGDSAGSAERSTHERVAPADPPAAVEPGGSEVRFPHPDHIRGLYVNAWAAGSSRRMEELLQIARTTEVNTLVIDIKDASGFVSHATQVPLAVEAGATEEIRIRDLPALLDRLQSEGIYPIARIVIVKDPVLAAARPDLAIQDSAGGVWTDPKGIVWLNLFDERVWEYHVDLALEVAEMGFPEIQWDYVRFPDAPASALERAVFPGQGGRTKADAVRGFLEYARERLARAGVRNTADVFGITTSARRDVGIGQVWEDMIRAVDVALPMVYPSHYWDGSFGFEHPNHHPYEVVRGALQDALERSRAVERAGEVRPWLQDFSLGSPAYGVPEVRAQIQAAYDLGLRDWILWNPSSRYTVGALEPVGGFDTEPLLRVADEHVPLSRRHEVLRSAAEPEDPPADSGGAAADTVHVPDSASGPGARPPGDTLPAPDSAGALQARTDPTN